MKTISVMLEYFHPWTNAAGFYVAREEGAYRDAGIDLEIIVPDPQRGDALAHLARHDVDFGVFPSNRLFVQRERGHPLIGIAAINHRALEVIQTITSTGIRRPRDLAGRRLALNPTPRGLAMVRHLVRADGGDPDRVQIVDSGVREWAPESFVDGQADASFGSYWAWDTLFASSVPDAERLIWPVDEVGAPAYHSYLLGTHEATVAADPDVVKRFVAATREGYLSAVQKPEKALAIFERVIPYFPRGLLERSLPLIASTWTHDGEWGIQRPELLDPYAQWLAENGVLARAGDSSLAYTNAFVSDQTV